MHSKSWGLLISSSRLGKSKKIQRWILKLWIFPTICYKKKTHPPPKKENPKNPKKNPKSWVKKAVAGTFSNSKDKISKHATVFSFSTFSILPVIFFKPCPLGNQANMDHTIQRLHSYSALPLPTHTCHHPQPIYYLTSSVHRGWLFPKTKQVPLNIYKLHEDTTTGQREYTL